MDVVILIAVGLAAGVLGAVCGVGGGVIVVPALLWLKGVGLKLRVMDSSVSSWTGAQRDGCSTRHPPAGSV